MDPLQNGAGAAIPGLVCLKPQNYELLKQGKITFELGLMHVYVHSIHCKDNRKTYYYYQTTG